MKKLLIVVLLTSVIFSIISALDTIVLLEERFSASTFPPSGWNIYELINNEEPWVRRTTGNPPNATAHVRSISQQPGTEPLWMPTYLEVDNWLVTAAIEVPSNATNVELLFHRSTSASEEVLANDIYHVMLSTTSNNPVTNLSAFTSVYNEQLSWSTRTWTQITVPLNNVAGETIYIAFRHLIPPDFYDGEMINIGNIIINANLGSNEPVITEFPFEEDFSNTTFPPENWRLIASEEFTTSGDWPSTYISNNWFRSTALGSNIARSNSEGPNWTMYNIDNFIITPAIALPSDVGVELTWSAIAFDGGYWWPAKYHVVVSTTTPERESFISVFNEELRSETYVTRVIDLTEYSGETIYIGFWAYEPDLVDLGFFMGNDDIGITNIKLSVTDASDVHDLVAENISGPNSITINHQANFNITISNQGTADVSSIAYNVQLMLEGIEPQILATIAGNSVTVGATTTVPINWIPTSVGVFQVYALVVFALDNDISNNQTSLHTIIVEEPDPIGPITNFPWEENFISTDFPPIGWTTIDNQNTGYNWLRALAMDGGNSIPIARSNSHYNWTPIHVDHYLITPPLQLPADAVVELTYRDISYNQWNGQPALYNIMVSTTTADISAFVTVSERESENRTLQPRSLDLSAYAGQTIHIAFWHYDPDFHLGWGGNGGDDLAVTNIRVTAEIPEEERDLAALSISGETSITQGVEVTYSITVSNVGNVNILGEDYTIELVQEPDIILGSADGIDLLIENNHQFNISFTPEIVAEIQLFGRIIHEFDTNPDNNETNRLNVNVEPPIMYDLAATSISGASTVVVNSLNAYTINVTNFGIETVAAGDYTVRIMLFIEDGDDVQLGEIQNGVLLAAGANHNYVFNYAFSSVADFAIYGEVIYELDQVLDNNKTNNHAIAVYPAPADFNFTENFSGTMFPPTGWSLIDADADGENWIRSQGYPPYPPGLLANAVSQTWVPNMWNYDIADPDNWLITPPLSLPEGSPAFLSYLVRTLSEYGFNPADNYSILVSTTTPVISSFTTIFTETLARTDVNWGERIISLTEYAGETIYIAFRHHDVIDTNNAYAMGLGNVRVWTPQIGDHDLIATQILGSTDLILNMSTTHTLRIQNNGSITASVYTIKLMQVVSGGEDVELARVSGTPISSNTTIDFPLTWTPRIEGNFQIYGMIDFVLDQNIANNTTSALNISVEDIGAPVLLPITVGDMSSGVLHRNPPFDLFDSSSVAQTIYFPNELEHTGLITEIGYNFTRYSGSVPAVTTVQIFMATTTQNSFGGWIPYESFVLVYEGQFPDFPVGDDHPLRFQLHTPFPYPGGNQNLVVMTHRMHGTYWGQMQVYQQTSQSQNRVRARTSRDVDVNPALGLTGGNMPAYYPNTWFTMQTTNIGSLSGVVRHDGEPLEGVEITITGTGIKTTTNAQGQYSFSILPAGLISITASKLMFETQIIDEVFIVPGQNVTHDIDMNQFSYDMAAVSVTGHEFPTAMQENIYNVLVRNEGIEPISGTAYTVELVVGNEFIRSEFQVLASANGITLGSGATGIVPINWIPENTGTMLIYARTVFDLDMNEENNISPAISVTVQAANTGFVYVGNPDSMLYNDWLPLNLIWDNGISQVIYQADLIDETGWITHLELDFWNWEGFFTTLTPSRFYLGTTNKNTYTNNWDWVRLYDHELVFDGALDFRSQGVYTVIVPLQTPFLYEGGNLVVTGHKPWGHHGAGHQFRSTPVSGYRVMHAGSDLSIYEPDTGIEKYWGFYDEGTGFIPNMGLRFQTGGGTISGNVTYQGVAVANAKITLNGTNMSVLSDSQGFYRLPNIIAGTVGIKASGHGFLDYFETDIVVVTGENTTVDIEMISRPIVSVTGTVYASDTNTGLSNALVTLTGYSDFSATTNSAGVFTLNNVFSDFEYFLEIEREGYVTHRMKDLYVGTDGENLGIITLEERARPPRNIVAYEENNNMVLKWDDPTQGNDVWFSHTDRVTFYDGAGIGEPLELKFGHRFTESQLRDFGVSGGYISIVSFMPADPGTVASFTIEIYTGGSNTPYNPGTLVHTYAVPSSMITQREWVDVNLDTLIPIPSMGELWIVINMVTTMGYPAGIDNGPVANGFGNIIFHENVWTTLLDRYPAMPFNFMIKAMAVNASSPSNPVGNASNPVGNAPNPVGNAFIRSEFNRDRIYSVGDAIIRSNSSNPVRNASIRPEPSILPSTPSPLPIDISKTERILLGYNIYRTVNSTPDISNWELVAFDITDTSYTDYTWHEVDVVEYRYIVEAVYSNNNISAPAFSRILVKGMQTPVNITLKTVNDVPMIGASIQLVNKTGNPDHVYVETSTSNTVNFPIVWLGSYDLTIKHPNFYEFTAELNILTSPFNYIANIHNQNILLSEGFETAFPPTGWTRLDNDGDGFFFEQYGLPYVQPYSGTAVAGSMSWYDNGTYDGQPLTPDNWLISPLIYLDGNAVNLRYFVATDDPRFPIETYSVLYSTTTPIPENFVQVHSETLYSINSFWQERNIDLSDLAGLSVYLAFRHHDSFDQFLVKFDDVLLTGRVPIHVDDKEDSVIPKTTVLKGNYPNPFNPITKIEFDVAKEGQLKIDVYNIRGQRVRSLVDDFYASGKYQVEWNGKDDNERDVASGVYFYRMQVGDFSSTRRMVLMK